MDLPEFAGKPDEPFESSRWVLPESRPPVYKLEVTVFRKGSQESVRGVFVLRGGGGTGPIELLPVEEDESKTFDVLELGVALTQPKDKKAKPEDWRHLQGDFESRRDTIVTLDADWNKEGDIDHGWSFRGDHSLVLRFEAIARRAGKLVLRSHYCCSALRKELLQFDDPIRVWLEAIRSLTGNFRVRGPQMWGVAEDGTKIPYYCGYIGDVYGASALLCLELESREDD